MLAEKNEYIADTVVTLRQLSEDEKIRMQCEARERYEHDIASYIRQGRDEGYQLGEQAGYQLGEQAGRDEGREEGELKRLIRLICKKLVKGKSLEDIADDLEEKIDDIRPMYEAAVAFSPDYDVEKVFEAYKKNKEQMQLLALT